MSDNEIITTLKIHEYHPVKGDYLGKCLSYLSQGKTLPVNTWAVTTEVRKQGSIGEFFQVASLERAEEDKVNEFTIKNLHDLGYEVRAILHKRRLNNA